MKSWGANTLTGLVQVVTRLPDFEVPAYSKLGEVRLAMNWGRGR